jgi:hypothetical protein
MNKKMITKTAIFLFFGGYLITGCEKNSNGLDKFVEENVVLASGVNFETKRLIALDPISEKEVKPCDLTGISEKNYQSSQDNKQTQCNIKLGIGEDPNSPLNAALKTSLKPIPGKIEREGKVIDAEYVIVVKALYKGSLCETDTSGGIQIENCQPVRRR